MKQPATKLTTRFFTLLARLSHFSPKGKHRLAIFFLRLASSNGFTPSFYGPLLQDRWHDTTFRFCISGMYGTYLSEFLRKMSYPYSFIDIGANVGLYSLIAADSRNCTKCYAFEPNPTVFDSLQQNIALNGAKQVLSYNCAVSDTEGWLNFTTTDVHSGIGRLASGDANAMKVKSVDKKLFDEMATTDQMPKIVKIDVEGHEPIVINELMKSKIWPDIRYLYFEADESRYDVGDVIKRLEAHGLRKISKIKHGGDCNLMFALEEPPVAKIKAEVQTSNEKQRAAAVSK